MIQLIRIKQPCVGASFTFEIRLKYKITIFSAQASLYSLRTKNCYFGYWIAN